MSDYTFLACRGIGEPIGDDNTIMGSDKFAGVKDFIKSHRFFEIVDLEWNASYGPSGGGFLGNSYAANLELGMIQINDYFESLSSSWPYKVILVGYSAGATLAGNYARMALETGHNHERIGGVVLISDPLRPLGGGTPLYTAPNFGIGGQRDIARTNFPVYWISDPMDPITSLPENSPLRTFADQTYACSFAPGEFPKWMADLASRVIEGRWQRVLVNPFDVIGTWRQYSEAVDAVNRYLFKGDHTSYPFRNVPGTGTQYLLHAAQLINNIVEEGKG